MPRSVVWATLPPSYWHPIACTTAAISNTHNLNGTDNTTAAVEAAATDIAIARAARNSPPVPTAPPMPSASPSRPSAPHISTDCRSLARGTNATRNTAAARTHIRGSNTTATTTINDRHAAGASSGAHVVLRHHPRRQTHH